MSISLSVARIELHRWYVVGVAPLASRAHSLFGTAMAVAGSGRNRFSATAITMPDTYRLWIFHGALRPAL